MFVVKFFTNVEKRMSVAVENIDQVNEDLKRLAELLPRGAAYDIAAMCGFHHNTIRFVLKATNEKVTDNVLDVLAATSVFLERHKDQLMDEANKVHQVLKSTKHLEA